MQNIKVDAEKLQEILRNTSPNKNCQNCNGTGIMKLLLKRKGFEDKLTWVAICNCIRSRVLKTYTKNMFRAEANFHMNQAEKFLEQIDFVTNKTIAEERIKRHAKPSTDEGSNKEGTGNDTAGNTVLGGRPEMDVSVAESKEARGDEVSKGS